MAPRRPLRRKAIVPWRSLIIGGLVLVILILLLIEHGQTYTSQSPLPRQAPSAAHPTLVTPKSTGAEAP